MNPHQRNKGNQQRQRDCKKHRRREQDGQTQQVKLKKPRRDARKRSDAFTTGHGTPSAEWHRGKIGSLTCWSSLFLQGTGTGVDSAAALALVHVFRSEIFDRFESYVWNGKILRAEHQ